MAIGQTLALVQALLAPVLYLFGVLFVLVIGLMLIGHKLPVVGPKIADWHMGQAMKAMGGMLILVQDADGHYTLTSCEYDSENNGYWADLPNGKEFYDAEGVGGNPGSFYGASLVTAYQGLGGVADLISGEVGRQAKIKQMEGEKNERASIAAAGKKLLGGNWLGDGGEDGVAADGGETAVDAIGEYDAVLPKKKVVDLRDTLHNAPFHVRPEAFHRVEKNAQKAQSGFASLGPVGQAGLIMGAMFLGGLLAWFVMGNSGGGGGSATLPFMLDMAGVM